MSDVLRALADRLEAHTEQMANTSWGLTMQEWNVISNDILLASRTLRAALAPVTDEEVAVVKAERDRAQRACEQMGERITSLEAELGRLRSEHDELEAVFAARWSADMRAIKRWQEETGKDNTWPDRTNMVGWLFDRVEQLETALKPFAAFAPQAEQFVSDAAKSDGSPVMPTKHFRLSDFERARAALEPKP